LVVCFWQPFKLNQIIAVRDVLAANAQLLVLAKKQRRR